MSPLRRWSFAACLILSALVSTACAGQSQALREAAAEHVYAQPLPELWPQVEAFMTEQGYVWRAASGHYALRTEWRESGTSGTTRTLVSYLVQGEAHPSGGCILRVLRGIKAEPNNQAGDLSAMTMTGTGTSREVQGLLSEQELSRQSQRAIYAPTRDLDMELELMRKLDPAGIAKVDARNGSTSSTK
jgi:hypothetical protein